MLVHRDGRVDYMRHIHLDFHTPDFVKVGEKFDVVRFFDTLESAEVNSIVVFALDHHGNSFFDTRTGRRHPGLDFDLLSSMSAEADKRAFPLMAYFSMNVNEVQARLHPEWAALWRDGHPVDSQILQDGSELFWTWLCPNRGPLIDEFFLPHIAEVLDNYPVSGVFVDMAGYLPGSCFCTECVGMMKARGVNSEDMTAHDRFNNDNIQVIARRIRELMDSRKPGMRLEMGGFNAYGEADKAKGVISDFYIESLAFQTGWQYNQIATRYFRKFGLPTLGMTGRFLKNWGDFGTVASPRQQKVQLSMHLMAGVGSSVGDHLPADCHLEEGVYDTIGQGFRFIKPRQPYCVGMAPVKEAAILVTEGEGANAATMNATGGQTAVLDSYKSACKMMTELHYQYEPISVDESLDGYKLLFVTHGYINMAFIDKVQSFLTDGGTLVVSGQGLNAVDSEVAKAWHRLIGVESFAFSEHQGEFYKLTDGRVQTQDIPRMAHYVHSQAIDVAFTSDVIDVAEDWHSPNVRSREQHYGHFHGPATSKSGTAVGIRKVGAGTVILIRPQVFPAYLQTGYYAHRLLVRNLLDSFMPVTDRVILTNAPTVVELALGVKDGCIVLQALPFITERRDRGSFESIVDDPIPFHGIWVDLPNITSCFKAYDPINHNDVALEQLDKGVRIHLPQFDEHLLIVLE